VREQQGRGDDHRHQHEGGLAERAMRAESASRGERGLHDQHQHPQEHRDAVQVDVPVGLVLLREDVRGPEGRDRGYEKRQEEERGGTIHGAEHIG
jgi:hypothetical protein